MCLLGFATPLATPPSFQVGPGSRGALSRRPRGRFAGPQWCATLRSRELGVRNVPRSSAEPLKRFALISDVHVFDPDGIWREDITDFSLHRILGLASIALIRGPNKYNVDVLAAALNDMRLEGVQHLVCAGDVTNLAMESEFVLARKLFSSFGPADTMTFCPGNHDIYVPAQATGALFHQYFGEFCTSDVPVYSPRGDGFPFLQIRGGVAFVALNTGLPNTASGEVGSAQWDAASRMLASAEAKEMLENARFRVLIQHHPAQNPAVRGTSRVRQFGHGSRDWQRLPEFASKHSFDLVVHGHLHVPYRARLAGAPDTLVYESGSGTLMSDDPARIARYTVFELEGDMLSRTYSRVWNVEKESFGTLELSIP